MFLLILLLFKDPAKMLQTANNITKKLLIIGRVLYIPYLVMFGNNWKYVEILTHI